MHGTTVQKILFSCSNHRFIDD